MDYEDITYRLIQPTQPTQFDLDTEGEYYIYSITSKIILHLVYYNYSTVQLYFTNDKNNRINIPDKIKIYKHDSDSNNDSDKVIYEPKEETFYLLVSTDNYTITFNDEYCLELKQKMAWNIYAKQNAKY